MSSFDNVTLEYKHPYIPIYLEDNTIYDANDEVVTPTPSFNGIQVGFFGAGRDNIMLYSTSTDMFINEYGTPNYKLYGQAAYNVVAALNTKQCGMYTLRLLPANATYANFVVMIDYKVETPTGEDGHPLEGATPKLKIKFRKTSVKEATTESKLKTGVAGMYSNVVGSEGYTSKPLFTFWQQGRGKYGNSTKIKFVDSVDYDSENNTYRTYQLQVMEPGKTGLTVKERINGTFSDELLDWNTDTSNPSTFIEDRVNDQEYGSSKISMMFHVDTWEDIVKKYQTVLEGNPDATDDYKLGVANLDIIFGLKMDGLANSLISIVDNSADDDYVNLISVDGFGLVEGSDGDLDATDSAKVEKTKTELLTAAFQGTIDPKLISRYGSPADFALDANFPDEVKREMAAFAAKREYDAVTYIDSGLLSTVSEVSNFLKELKNLNAYNLVKECGSYKYRDSDYTGKIIPMTITQYVAKALPKHISINQFTTPWAREDARLKAGIDFVAGTFVPIINPDMNDVKKQIYSYGANCYETVSSGVVQRSTAITTCPTNSDRKLEFNEYILHKAVKIAYDILNSKLYKIGEETERLAYQTQAEKEISFQLSAYLRSVSVQFVMSAADEKKSIMRLRMRLVFKTVITRGVLEIYLDPRTGTVTDATTISSTSTAI